MTNAPVCPKIVSTPTVGQKVTLLADGTPLSMDWPSPWPFKREEHSALAWWRTFAADSFHDADREHLLMMLRRVSILRGDEELATALHGAADAAIGAALATMPIDKITLQVDIAMTALLSVALNRNGAASLVMAQVIGLTDLAHPFAMELAGSWLSYGMRHSTAPDKFGEAVAVLWESFQERHAVADKAGAHFDEAAALLAAEPDA
jgi:hypothetical protein